MASESGLQATALEALKALTETPHRFALFQALRRVEVAFRARPRLGEAVHPSEEPVRLGQEPSLGFSPGEIASFGSEEGAPPSLKTLSFGVFGPNGPLPLHLTEYARDRLRNSGDATFARFVDLFHHRMLALFYRAFANGEPTVNLDRPDTDRFALYVGALIGRALRSQRGRGPLSDRASLFYAGLLARPARDADGLRLLLAEHLRVPVAIEQFVGEWAELPEADRWRLGQGGRLGTGSIVGRRVWLVDGKFRVVLGPLRRAQLQRLLPGEPGLIELGALVRSYVGDTLHWDARLVLDEADWQTMTLGQRARLGWDSWVGTRPGKKCRSEIIVDPNALPAEPAAA